MSDIDSQLAHGGMHMVDDAPFAVASNADINVVRKMVALGFRIGNEVRCDKLGPIHDFQAGAYNFVDNYRHPLGIKEDPRDLAVGFVALFNSLNPSPSVGPDEDRDMSLLKGGRVPWPPC